MHPPTIVADAIFALDVPMVEGLLELLNLPPI